MTAGHTHAEKWLVAWADGRSALVKAAQEPRARSQIERERLVLEAVAAPFMPRLLGAAADESWSLLVLEDLSAAAWPPPYPDEVRGLLAVLEELREVTPPSGLERRPEGRPLGTYWQRIAANPEPVLAHGACSAAWLGRAAPVLHEAESLAVLAGDDLLHDDVWHANVCYAERGAVLIDWASATIGDRRLDLAYALLSVRACGQTPPAVDFPDEAAYAALLAGATAWHAAQPIRPRSCAARSFTQAGYTTSATRWRGRPSCSSSRRLTRSADEDRAQALDRLRHEPVERPRPAALRLDEASLAQQAQVVRDRRLRELERGRQVADADLRRRREPVDDRDAGRIREGLEDERELLGGVRRHHRRLRPAADRLEN